MKFGDVLKERLEESIRDEKKAGPFYLELAKLADDPNDKKTILGLAADEDRHLRELKQLYTKTYPDEDLDLVLKDDSALPKAEDKKMLEGKRKASYELGDTLKEKQVGKYRANRSPDLGSGHVKKVKSDISGAFNTRARAGRYAWGSDLSNVHRDIEREKQKLITKYKSKGLYENFGQAEVRKLEDKYRDSQYKNDGVWDAIRGFDEWAMNFTGKELNASNHRACVRTKKASEKYSIEVDWFQERGEAYIHVTENGKTIFDIDSRSKGYNIQDVYDFLDDNGIRWGDNDALISYLENIGILRVSNNIAKEDEIWGWSKNIANNYNREVDTNLLSQLYDACNELGLNKAEMDMRWQYFSVGDYVSASDIYYLLTGGRRKNAKLLRSSAELTLANVSVWGEEGSGLDYTSLFDRLSNKYPEVPESNIEILAQQISDIGERMSDITGGDLGDWVLEEGVLSFGVMQWVIDDVKESGAPGIPGFRFMRYVEGGPESQLVYKLVEVAKRMAKLLRAYTPEEIAQKHGVEVKDMDKAIQVGQKIEMEHTDDPEEAARIASHHLWETPKYYDEKVGLPAMEEKLEKRKSKEAAYKKTAAAGEMILEGEAPYSAKEMLEELGGEDDIDIDDIDIGKAEAFMKRYLEGSVEGLNVLDVEFVEYDSSNISHATMYFWVKVKGTPSVLLRASEEETGAIFFGEGTVEKLRGKQSPSSKEIKASSIIALSKVADFGGLVSMQRRFASVIKVAEVKDTEASRLVECFHDGEKFILCHKYDGQIVIPVGSKYMVVVGSHHVIPFDRGFVYVNSYTGEISPKNMDEVKQTLFPEIIAELRRQGMEFEPDLKKAPEVSKAMEEMFDSTDNYQKAIFDILK